MFLQKNAAMSCLPIPAMVRVDGSGTLLICPTKPCSTPFTSPSPTNSLLLLMSLRVVSWMPNEVCCAAARLNPEGSQRLAGGKRSATTGLERRAVNRPRRGRSAVPVPALRPKRCNPSEAGAYRGHCAPRMRWIRG